MGYDFASSYFVRLVDYPPAPLAVKQLPEDVARRHAVVPLGLDGEDLIVATASPVDKQSLQAVAAAARRPVRPLLATYPEIRAALNKIYGGQPISPPRPRLGQLLRHLGHITAEGLARALADQAETGDPLGQICLRLGLVDEYDLVEALAWQHYLPHFPLHDVRLQPALTALVPWELAEAERVIPLWWLGNVLVMGTAALDRLDRFTDIAEQLGLLIWPVVCTPSEWAHHYQQLYLRGKSFVALDPGAMIEALLDAGAVSELEVAGARALSRQKGQPLDEVLLDQGLISCEQWLRTRARLLDIPAAPMPETVSSEVASCLPAPIARACQVVPLDRANDRLIVGMVVPDSAQMALIEDVTGLHVEPRLVDPVELEAQLGRLYTNGKHRRAAEPGARFGKLLIETGLVTPAQLDEALAMGSTAGQRLGERLVNLGYLSDIEVAAILGLQAGLPYVRLEHAPFDENLVRQVPPALARKHLMLPLLAMNGSVWIAVADSLDGMGLRAMEGALGMPVWPLIVPRSVIIAAIDRFLGPDLCELDVESHRLVKALIQHGLLNQSQAAAALQCCIRGERPLDQAIVSTAETDDMEITKVLADALGVPVLDLQLRETMVKTIDPVGQPVMRRHVKDPIDAATARLISLEMARRLRALPVWHENDQVRVAFANPAFGPALEALETTLGRPVLPGLVPHGMLEEAIQRVLGRKTIGTYLMLAGIITRSQLNDALDLAQRTGVRIGRALLNRGYVTQDQLYQFLATQAGLPLFDLDAVEYEEAVVHLIDAETARAYGILPLSASGKQVTLAMVDPLDTEALAIAERVTGRPARPVLVTEADMEVALERIYSHEYLARSTSGLLERSPENSAYRVLSDGQKVALAAVLVLSLVWLALDYKSFLIGVNTFASLFYLSFSAYKFYLVYRAMAHSLEVPVTEEEVAALDHRDLPVYTVLVPVYREAEVLPDLLRAIGGLDYPTTKLDIKVLMEADDAETIAAFQHLNMPAYFQGIVVPSAQPKTKPKACNYGLIHARGEYVVIFDAEDLPEPDQLKRILVVYSKVPPEVVCVQAKLNYYNRNQNLLTRWFTVEYSMWFDLFLPGLDASGAPIPLGGTSNHFKRHALIEVGAWDPYNVTEDADLGLRLYKWGYKTATVDSTTYEEANSEVYNWIRQRSRWLKGYIQTWLVHMRHPVALMDKIGLKAFLSFQLVIGGTFFAALLNPIYWFLTTLWFLTEWGFIREIFPGAVFYVGAVSLYLGNFAFVYMNVIGAMRREYYDIVKYALLSPLYWVLMSIAAWKGFLQLIRKPHFWEKTVHGLYQGVPNEATGNG